MISVIIPYIDQLDELSLALEYLEMNTTEYELILVDNGSEKALEIKGHYIKHIHNKSNVGVLKTFQQGLENADQESQTLVFLHSDVLILERAWDLRLEACMDKYNDVGILGFFGARGTGSNGGRIGSMSNMQGRIWGKCECHEIVGLHHGELRTDFSYAGGLDGLSIIFRRDCLQDLADHTDIFEDWRAPFHFYDRIMPCKVIDRGWKIGFLGVAFDHMSGATACRSEIYRQWAAEWLHDHDHVVSENPDHDIYLLAEKQFFDEFGLRLGVIVDELGNYQWNI